VRNKEQHKIYQRKWRKEHPLYQKKYNDKYAFERRYDASSRFIRAKSSAKYRKLEFTLSKQQFINLIAQPCWWCGGVVISTSSGLDRLHSNIGYVENNVVSCCTTCNMAKNSMTPEEFRVWIAKVYDHQFKVS